MKRADAKKLAKTLVRQGCTYKEIRTKLFDAGFRSAKSGGHMSLPGISYMLTHRSKRKKRQPVAAASKRQPVAAASGNASARLAAVRTILAIRDMEAGDRIAMIHLLLG